MEGQQLPVPQPPPPSSPPPHTGTVTSPGRERVVPASPTLDRAREETFEQDGEAATAALGDMPTALRGLPPDQLVRLQRRRDQERAVEQNRSNNNKIVDRVIPVRMFFLTLFCIMLLVKLDSNPSGLPWAVVISPLWAANVLKIGFHVYKLKELMRQIREPTIESPHHLVGVSLLNIVGDVGSVLTKFLLVLKLEKTVHISLTATFMPFWVAICCGALIKFFTPLDPAVARRIYYKRIKRLYEAIMYSGISILMPIIICSKVDGYNPHSWSTSFIPLWFFCINLAVVAFILLPVYMCSIMFGETASVYHAREERRRMGILIGIFIYGIGSTVICFFLFLLFLARRLDTDGTGSNAPFMIPLICMHANLMMFTPVAKCIMARMSTFRRGNEELPDEVMDTQAGTTAGYGDNTEGLFTTITTPVTLLQQSTTLFRKLDGSEDSGGENDWAGKSPFDMQAEFSFNIKGITALAGARSAAVHPLKVIVVKGDDSESSKSSQDGKNDDQPSEYKVSIESLGTVDERNDDNMLEEYAKGKEGSEAGLDQTDGNASSEKPPSSNTYETTTECFICADRKANAVIMDCGHGGICYQCGLKLARREGEKQCPVCRSTIKQVLKLGWQSVNSQGEVIVTATEGMLVRRGETGDHRDSADGAGAEEGGNEESTSAEQEIVFLHT
jgi:hypothetical protein